MPIQQGTWGTATAEQLLGRLRTGDSLKTRVCSACDTHGLRMSISESSSGAAAKIIALPLIPQKGLDAAWEGGEQFSHRMGVCFELLTLLSSLVKQEFITQLQHWKQGLWFSTTTHTHTVPLHMVIRMPNPQGVFLPSPSTSTAFFEPNNLLQKSAEEVKFYQCGRKAFSWVASAHTTEHIAEVTRGKKLYGDAWQRCHPSSFRAPQQLPVRKPTTTSPTT